MGIQTSENKTQTENLGCILMHIKKWRALHKGSLKVKINVMFFLFLIYHKDSV